MKKKKNNEGKMKKNRGKAVLICFCAGAAAAALVAAGHIYLSVEKEAEQEEYISDKMSSYTYWLRDAASPDGSIARSTVSEQETDNALLFFDSE